MSKIILIVTESQELIYMTPFNQPQLIKHTLILLIIRAVLRIKLINIIVKKYLFLNLGIVDGKILPLLISWLLLCWESDGLEQIIMNQCISQIIYTSIFLSINWLSILDLLLIAISQCMKIARWWDPICCNLLKDGNRLEIIA